MRRLGKQIEALIDDLFGDTSVPQSKTLDELEDILVNVEMKIKALRADMKQRALKGSR